MADWVILGCGYVGTRLARALLDEGGHRVRVGARHLDKLAPLGERGAEVHAFEASRSRAFGPMMYGLSSPNVVYSVPPIPNLPTGEAIRRAADAAAAVGAARFVYLGSSGVYGETPDGEVVDEETPVAIGDPEATPRIGEESAVDMARLVGLSTIVLRLAAIYGPGRGVRERLKAGTYKLIDEGAHWFSRVHVDDIVGIIRAAVARAPAGSVYCVADDRPSTQREYAAWLCRRLGLPLPPSVPSLASGAPRRAVRNRKLSNAKLVRELGYTFSYPSFVEGELAIERETGVVPVSSTPEPVAVAAPVAVAPAAPVAATAAPVAAAPVVVSAGDAGTALRALLQTWRARSDEALAAAAAHLEAGRTAEARAALADGARALADAVGAVDKARSSKG